MFNKKSIEWRLSLISLCEQAGFGERQKRKSRMCSETLFTELGCWIVTGWWCLTVERSELCGGVRVCVCWREHGWSLVWGSINMIFWMSWHFLGNEKPIVEVSKFYEEVSSPWKNISIRLKPRTIYKSARGTVEMIWKHVTRHPTGHDARPTIHVEVIQWYQHFKAIRT